MKKGLKTKLVGVSLGLAAILSVAACGSAPKSSSSSSVTPSSSAESSSQSSAPSSSETQYTKIEITNKSDLQADWYVGQQARTLALTTTPAGNIDQLIMQGKINVTSSNPAVATAVGKAITPVSAGKATITVTIGNVSDSVEVTIQAEKIYTIAEVVSSAKSGDAIKFKGVIVGNTTRLEYFDKSQEKEMVHTMYVDDGTGCMNVYRTFTKDLYEGWKIGDVVSVEATYKPYTSLVPAMPETKQQSSKFTKIEEQITPSAILEVSASKQDDISVKASTDYSKRVEVKEAVVTEHSVIAKPTSYTIDGKTLDTKNHTIKFSFGEQSYSILFEERYYVEDSTEYIKDIQALKVGDKISCIGFINDNYSISDIYGVQCVIEDPDPVETVEMVSVAPNLKVGKNFTFTAKCNPATSIQSVTWSSDNTDVATVDANSGKVTAVAVGKANIIATSTADTTKSTSYEMNVIADPSTLNHGTAEAPLTVAEARTLLDAYGGDETSKDVIVSGEVKKSVYNTQYKNVELWLGPATTAVGGLEVYSGVLDAKYTGDYSADNALVGYTASASGHGKIYSGTYELTNYKDSGSGSYVYPQVFKLECAPTGISVDKEEVKTVIGGSSTVTATLTPEAAVGTISWVTSDSAIATVNAGVVTGVAKGTCTITAFVDADKDGEVDADEIKKEIPTEISEGAIPLTSVTITGTNNFYHGESTILTATPNDGALNVTYDWELVGEDVKATLEPVADHPEQIKVLSSDNSKHNVTIKVTAHQQDVDDVSKTKAVAILPWVNHAGTQADPYDIHDACLACDRYASGSTDSYYIKGKVSKIQTAFSGGKMVVWLSDSGEHSGTELFEVYMLQGLLTELDVQLGDTIVINGKVKVYESGESKVYETNGNATFVDCTKGTPVAPAICNVKDLTLAIGADATLSPIVGPTKGTDLGYSYSYESSATGVATVDANGKITAVAGGNAVITITASKQGEANVTKTVNVKVQKAEVIDFTKKLDKHGVYNDEWKYGANDEYTIYAGANNNGDWAFVKFGAKNTDTTAYVKTDNGITDAVNKIDVVLNSGNMPQAKMSATIQVEVYSDSSFTNKTYTSDAQTVTKGAGTYSFSNTSPWAAGSYYKIIISTSDTSGKNGVVWVDTISFIS